jgi:hypothetical protein
MVQTIAMKVLIEVMAEVGIKRLLTLTGTGVRFPEDRIRFIDKMLNLMVGKIDPSRIADGRACVELLKKSTLEWTIVRVLKLASFDFRAYSLCSHGPSKVLISREHVARLLLLELQDPHFIQQAPIIGLKGS